MAPASETKPPTEWTTVEPAKSWNPMPRLGRKLPFEPIVASQPPGPQTQWPRIG